MIIKPGFEEESVYLLHDCLKAWPRLAVAAFPASQQWICVESDRREYVEKLCVHLSTFHHPLQIIFVPMDEHLTWLHWQHQTSRITAPAWVRLKRRSELEELLSMDPILDKRILKYANALAFVGLTPEPTNQTSEPTIQLVLVPRLLVPISNNVSGQDNSNTRRNKRMPRLLHTSPLGDPLPAGDYLRDVITLDHHLDPTVWWHPHMRYNLQEIEFGVYRLIKPNHKRAVKGGDDFIPPFAFFRVTHAALQSDRAVPKLNELTMFAEGMAIGRRQFDFRAPNRDFLQWTFDNHIAARVEIGQKVEAKVGGGMTRGVIEDILLTEVTLRIKNTEQMGVDICWVRRFYEVGDVVKVVKASNLNREGWVVCINEGEIVVFDRNAKEHVRASWSDMHDITNFETVSREKLATYSAR